jgi:hypothetical protein
MSFPCYHLSLDHCIYICREVKVMELLIMLNSQICRQFISLRPKFNKFPICIKGRSFKRIEHVEFSLLGPRFLHDEMTYFRPVVTQCVKNLIDIFSVLRRKDSGEAFFAGHLPLPRRTCWLVAWRSYKVCFHSEILCDRAPNRALTRGTVMDKFSAGRYSNISTNSSSCRSSIVVILLTCISCTWNKHWNVTVEFSLGSVTYMIRHIF